MLKTTKRQAVAVIGAIILELLCVNRVFGEEADHSWYQVELILFAFHQGTNKSTEAWHGKATPDYPSNLTILRQYRSPSVIRAQTSELDDDLINDPYDAAIALIDEVTEPDISSETPAHNLPDATTEASTPYSPTENRDASPTDSTEQQTPELLVPFDIDALPKRLAPPMDIRKEAFVTLPERELTLNRARQRIDRALDLRLLAHLAWRQPATPATDSPAVFIQAGKQFGIHFELEGTLTVREKRYLHVDTDMFFSEYKTAILAEHKDWSAFLENKTKPETSLFDLRSDGSLLIDSRGLTSNQQNPYTREITAELKQSKRIKSGELHYLDHPLFGILVQLTEYQLPDPVLEMDEFDIDALPQKKALPRVSVLPDAAAP